MLASMTDPHENKGGNDDLDRRLAIGVAIGLSLGSSLGVALGAAIGAATGNIAIWIALGVSVGAGLGLSAGILIAAMRRRSTAGECTACGYPTKGLRSRVCPECGAEVLPAREPDERTAQE